MVVSGLIRLLATQRFQVAVGQAPEESEAQQRREAADWLRDRFGELGPPFIKLGQIISSRPDLFPTEWVESFASLQANVPAFSFDEVRQVVEEEFGKPIDQLFVSISKEPLATASIGQVHRVTVKVGDQLVDEVIKVQRPGIEQLIRTDLAIFRSIVQHLFFLPRLSQGQDLAGTIRELENSFDRELDFVVEANNTATFGRNFSDPQYRIVVPSVDWERTSRRVLALSYVPGTKISEFNGSRDEVEDILGILIPAFLKQFVEDGVFHADPHPGNVAITRNASGRLQVILYDFGMLGTLSPKTRQALFTIAGAAIRSDERALIRSLIEIGILSKDAANNPDIEQVFVDFLADLGKQPLSAESIALLRERLFNASDNGGIQVPGEFTLVGRALIPLEGLVRVLSNLAPGIDVSSAALPKALPLLSKILGEPIGLLERADYDGRRLARLLGITAQKGQRLFRQLEEGKLELPVKDSSTARAVRRLRFGAKSVSSAVIFVGFFIPGAFALIDGKWLPAVPLLGASAFFLERWFFGEKRMDS